MHICNVVLCSVVFVLFGISDARLFRRLLCCIAFQM